MEKKFVAFLDILGFKKLVENNDLSKVTEIYQEVIKKTFDLSFGVIKKAGLGEKFADVNIKSMIVSDSIVMWSNNDGINSFFSMAVSVQCMLYISLKLGIPLRGALVHGELSAVNVDVPSEYRISDSPIILGRGISEAYRLEGIQNWSGCIIPDESMLHVINSCSVEHDFFVGNLAANGLLSFYDVPTKDNKQEGYFCINWPMTTHLKMSEAMIRDAFSMHNKSINEHIEAVIAATVAYNDYCWDLEHRGYCFEIEPNQNNKT